MPNHSPVSLHSGLLLLLLMQALLYITVVNVANVEDEDYFSGGSDVYVHTTSKCSTVVVVSVPKHSQTTPTAHRTRLMKPHLFACHEPVHVHILI